MPTSLPDPLLHTMHEWQPFYQLTGEVAGTLVGLMFLTMTLASRYLSEDQSVELRTRMTAKVRAFMSPTVIHLTSVMIVSAIMCMPMSSALTVCVFLGVAGLPGLVFLCSTLTFLRAHHQRSPMDKDSWIFHFHLPLACYVALLVTAIALYTQQAALPFLAAATIVFLVLSIRNSWQATLYSSGVFR